MEYEDYLEDEYEEELSILREMEENSILKNYLDEKKSVNKQNIENNEDNSKNEVISTVIDVSPPVQKKYLYNEIDNSTKITLANV